MFYTNSITFYVKKNVSKTRVSLKVVVLKLQEIRMFWGTRFWQHTLSCTVSESAVTFQWQNVIVKHSGHHTGHLLCVASSPACPAGGQVLLISPFSTVEAHATLQCWRQDNILLSQANCLVRGGQKCLGQNKQEESGTT